MVMLFVVLALVLLVVLVIGLLLWWCESRHHGTSRMGYGLALPLLVVLLGGLGYFALGFNSATPSWLQQQREYDGLAKQIIDGQTPDELDDRKISVPGLALVLQSRLVRDPSATGWYTLGLLYDQMGGPARAREAAQRALRLSPQDVSARLLMVRTLIEQADGRLTDDAYQQLQTILKVHPEHDGAWILLAMSAGRAHRYDAAAEAWRSLLSRHGDGKNAELLRKGLQHAQQQQAQADRLDGLTVKVAAAAPAGGTLFVFVREKGQDGQPLAARRVLVDAFPATVTLRAEDWLGSYPQDLSGLRVAARYTPARGSSVANAGIRSESEPVRLGDRPAATLRLAPDGAQNP